MNHFYHNSSFGQDWFDYADVYSRFVQNMKDNSHFIEIGSWKGKSTAFMAVEIINSNKKIKFDCIDTWLGSDEDAHTKDNYVQNNSLYELFISNIEPVKHIINPIRATSAEASTYYSDNSVDIVFIDACHTYECVKKDIQLWFPKVKNGGILSGHDYTSSWPGVVLAVDGVLGQSNIESRNSCWIYHKSNN